MEHANIWTMTEAKRYLGRLLKQASSSGPQIITKRGKPVVVVVSIDEVEKVKRGDLAWADLFAGFGGVSADFMTERVKPEFEKREDF